MTHKVLLNDYDLMSEWVANDSGKSQVRLNRWRNRAQKFGLPRVAGAPLRDRVYALLRNDRRKPREEVSNTFVFCTTNHTQSLKNEVNV